MTFVDIIVTNKDTVLFGLLVIQLVWYILKFIKYFTQFSEHPRLGFGKTYCFLPFTTMKRNDMLLQSIFVVKNSFLKVTVVRLENDLFHVSFSFLLWPHQSLRKNFQYSFMASTHGKGEPKDFLEFVI